MLVAAALAAAVLLLDHGRPRALAMIAALLASGAGIATLVAETVDDNLSRQPALAAGAALAGAVGVLIVAALLVRRPHLVALLALAVLPFRVPIPVGDDAANLLVPLYVVTIAGALAYAWRWRRGESGVSEARAPAAPAPAAKWVERALAAFIVLYALQATYSSDIPQATKNIAFFYVPFAVLFRLTVDTRWTEKLLRTAFYVVAGLALVFAAVGFIEFATGHLLIPNPKVVAANEAKPYFRVNSLFFDPNIYGRFVGLTMVMLATVLVWTRRGRTTVLLSVALAVLWAGLVLSLSQTSFAALLAGLAVIAVLRYRPAVVGAVTMVVVVAGVAVVVASPKTFGLGNPSEKSLNRATSGRVKLTRAGLEMARERPVWGFGSGSFADRYRQRERVFSPLAAAESHTIPLTIAAEQGALGLLAYLALLLASLRLVFAGVRAALRERVDVVTVARAAVAAAFCAFVVHTLGYAAFLEDPLGWVLLGLAAVLGQAVRPPAPFSGRGGQAGA